MKSSITKLFVLVTALALPVVSFAQRIYSSGTNPLFRLIDLVVRVVRYAGPFLIAIIGILVLVNIIKFVTSDESAKDGLKGNLLKSILALFIALALIGIIHVIGNVLGVGIGGTISQGDIPQVMLQDF